MEQVKVPWTGGVTETVCFHLLEAAGWARWCLHLIPAVRRQASLSKFKASLDCTKFYDNTGKALPKGQTDCKCSRAEWRVLVLSALGDGSGGPETLPKASAPTEGKPQQTPRNLDVQVQKNASRGEALN